MEQQPAENVKFIRGQRILDQLNEDSTYPGLYREIERGFPDTQRRQHATDEVQIVNIQYLPFVNNQMLQVMASVRSNQHPYSPIIQFLNVTFEQVDTNMNVTFTGKDGKEYNMLPVDLTGSSVKVRCNCLDFYHRFAQTNAADGSLLGDPPPTYRPVPGSNRPPANPLRVPGLCRHLIKVVEHLQEAGMVK